MAVKATLINAPEGAFRKRTLKDFFEKMCAEHIEMSCFYEAQTFEHGLKITFKDDRLYFNDHTLDVEFHALSQAELYILDTGEIYYFNLGQQGKSYDPYGEIVEEEYKFIDMSSETDKLQKRLGKEFKVDGKVIDFIDSLGLLSGTSLRQSLKAKKEEKINQVLELIRDAIKDGTYLETAYKYDPNTKQYSSIGKEEAFTEEEIHIKILNERAARIKENEEQQGGKTL